MNEVRNTYYTVQSLLFPLFEENSVELTPMLRTVIETVELVRPGCFLAPSQIQQSTGRPRHSREHIARAFIAKAVYNIPTTRVLVDMLKSDHSLRFVCGWESAGAVPSEATFSRVFTEFARDGFPDRVHEALVRRCCEGHLVGHGSLDSTAIEGREKACRKSKASQAADVEKAPRRRGRRSKAEKAAAEAAGQAVPGILERQLGQDFAANEKEIRKGCDWGGKRNSKGRTDFWLGYKLHVVTGDGDVPLACLLSSASLHDSQAAIPAMQKAAQRCTILYERADKAYDCKEIRQFAEACGMVAVIDPKAHGADRPELAPAQKARYRQRSSVERSNSDLKDNCGGRGVRVRGHLKVFCHLMFGILAITARQLFTLFA